MGRTSIELSDENREKLKEARLPHESSYDDTIGRLLENHDVPFVTESEVRDIVSNMVVLEALQ